MDKKDMAAQAEKYKQEMMKLYGKSPALHNKNSAPQEETVAVVNVLPQEDEPPVAEETSGREITAEVDAQDTPQNEGELEERYPEPDLSELADDFGQAETDGDAEKLGDYVEDSDYNGDGYIIVNVRTGDQADPIENAVVHISSTNNGKSYYNVTGKSDNSGMAGKFSVPAPALVYSQTPDSKERPYALYDISVTANGFFNARSVDVPVFEGITSVQNFSMVPLPLYMKSSEETVTYYNQEPNL